MDYYDIAGLAKTVYPELESVGEHDYSLWLGDTQIYTGRKFQGLYNLDPVDDNQYRFVGHSNAYAALQNQPRSGELDLVWQYQGEEGISEVRCPFLTYRHEVAEYRPFAAAKYRIQKSSQGQAIKVTAR